MATSSAVVLLHGNKYFWRTRNTIDVTIVHHKSLEVIEVIAYEPSLDIEAERIYLDQNILISGLDQELIAAKLSLAMRSNVPHTEKIVEGIYNELVSEFILSRLIIKHFVKEESSFEVQIQTTFLDRDEEFGVNNNTGKLLRGKPADLNPYVVFHHRTPT